MDDAIPSALLKAELIGTGVASVSVVAPSGLAGFEQVSPGHVRLEGTLSALDATLNVGVSVTVLPGNPPGATLEITIDDQGNSGSGTPYTASLLIPVEVSPPLE